MKSFNWEELLRHHPIFSSLDAKQIARLLDEDVSQERRYGAHAAIISAGDSGASLLLIGSGTVHVVLPERNGGDIPVAVLRPGEICGEMAVFRRQPRSATVLARQPCVLLEIQGEAFLQLAFEHPDIEFKVLLMLSERLRHVNEAVLGVKLKHIDEKLNFFNTKIDAELKVVDASVRAAQTVFDQIRIRTDEVINSAEQNRTRVSFFLTTVVAIMGLLGISEILSIKNIWKEFTDIRVQQIEIKNLTSEIKNDVKAIENLVQKIRNLSQELESSRKLIDANRMLIADVRAKIADHIFYPALIDVLSDHENPQKAINLYDDLRQLKSMGEQVKFNRFDLLGEIKNQLVQQERPNIPDYRGLLWRILEENIAVEERTTTYFLLLTNAILLDLKSFDNGKTFDAAFAEFRRYAAEHKQPAIKRAFIEPFDQLFEGESRERREVFQRLRKPLAVQ
jgi:CRP-like cAMP-binding protein